MNFYVFSLFVSMNFSWIFHEFFSSLLKVIVLFEIMYKSPDDEAGNFEPRHLIEPIQRQYQQTTGHYDSLDDDQQKLLDIEQNIANLEKNLIHGNRYLMLPHINWCHSQANICQFNLTIFKNSTEIDVCWLDSFGFFFYLSRSFSYCLCPQRSTSCAITMFSIRLT